MMAFSYAPDKLVLSSKKCWYVVTSSGTENRELLLVVCEGGEALVFV